MKEKIHWLYIKDGRQFYLCNQSATPKLAKTTENQNEVSCKNCRKILGY